MVIDKFVAESFLKRNHRHTVYRFPLQFIVIIDICHHLTKCRSILFQGVIHRNARSTRSVDDHPAHFPPRFTQHIPGIHQLHKQTHARHRHKKGSSVQEYHGDGQCFPFQHTHAYAQMERSKHQTSRHHRSIGQAQQILHPRMPKSPDIGSVNHKCQSIATADQNNFR